MSLAYPGIDADWDQIYNACQEILDGEVIDR